MSHTFRNILTYESALLVADYLVKHIAEHASPETVEYDYDISQGKMIDTGDYNTTYRFDTEENTLLRKVIDVMAAIEEMPQEEIDIESEWKRQIIDIINQVHIPAIRDALRAKIFKSIQPELVPMEPFELLDIDINPRPDVDFVIIIQRMVPKEQMGQPEVVQPGQKSLKQELLEYHLETGMSFDEIVARKKAEKDPRYETVFGAYKRKYLYDVEMMFAVDYSLTPREEFIAKMKEKNGSQDGI